jgi:hypothetical protein
VGRGQAHGILQIAAVWRNKNDFKSKPGFALETPPFAQRSANLADADPEGSEPTYQTVSGPLPFRGIPSLACQSKRDLLDSRFTLLYKVNYTLPLGPHPTMDALE